MYINLITIDLCPGQNGGGVTPSGTLTISENGEYNVYSYASASVDVHPSISLSETYLSNGSYTITGEFNGGMVTVNVPSPQFVTESLSVSANGTYTPGEGVDGYSQVVVDVPQSVTGFTQKDLTEGTIEIINLNNSASFVASSMFISSNIQTVNLPYATSVGASAFFGCKSLTQVSLPMCSSIGAGAFQSCTSLTQVSLPMCSYIGKDGFNYTSLTQVSLPVCSFIGSYAFHNCGSLSQVSLPMCSYIGKYGFEYCSSLSQVDLPMCSSISAGAFFGCKSLTQVSLPVCSHIGNYAFQSCTSLTQVSLPMCRIIDGAAFYYCPSLTQVSLPVCSFIGEYAFYICSSLSIITIGYSSVCSLYYSDVFQGTPIASGTGSIYVPASLVDAYKSASGWSYFSSVIFPIMDEFEFINGLVVGSASTMDSTYLDVLNISADQVISVSMYNVESLESSTFMNYPNLISISFPKLTYYGDDTFAGCTSLSEVTIKLPSIGDRVFAECTSLETVNVNFNGLVTIGSDVFSGCTALTSIYVNENDYSDYLSAQNWSDYSSFIVPTIPELEFRNGLVFGYASSINNDFLNILGITSEQVTSVSLSNCLYLGNSTFYSCQNLLTVDIPECSYIGLGAFSECINLKSINLAKCEYIASQAFQGAFQSNGSYINLVLPVCSYIGGSAFYWAQVLSTITLESNSVCIINGDPFEEAHLNSIYVPASLVDEYKSATYWELYSNIIVPISE